ncbi:hypothetical protein [Kitasatospora sp. NPDC093806]|uniref:hypothetical protein n=1 Tax=Kitasatospora sp. NPDC093806 TaxID=3155075 RepID=UPI003417B1B5
MPSVLVLANAPRASALRPAGGEARGAVRLEVRTNGATGTEVRVRSDEQLLRVYRLTNQAEYPLTVSVLKDAQVSGAAVVCGSQQPFTLPPLGTAECSATLPARPGPQRTEVRAEADPPKGKGLPKAVATAAAGYRGLVAGLTLTRVGAPTGSGVLTRAGRTPRRALAVDQSPVLATPFNDPVEGAGQRALPAVVGGDIRLRYRVDAVGDSPISAVSVVDHLPGVGPVGCSGQSAGGLLVPGSPLDCTAAGEAVPGRHTAVARAEGLAADGAVGQDGRPLPPRPVAAEAAGDYEGQGPAPAQPGGATGPAPATGGRPPAAGTAANGAAAPPGTAPGGPANTGANAPPPNAPPLNPAAPNPAAAPAGSAAGPNAPANAAANAAPNPAAGGAAAAADAANPAAANPAAAANAAAAATAGQAAAAAAAAAGSAVPFRPGTSLFGLPASPFQAVPAAGAAAAAGTAGAAAAPAAPGAAAAGAAGTTAQGAAGGAAPGGAAAGSSTTGSGQAGASGSQPGNPAGNQAGNPAGNVAGNPAGNAASSAQRPDDAPFDWDDDWGTGEVLMLLLAIMLPVLVILAAALTVRQRRSGDPGGGGAA